MRPNLLRSLATLALLSIASGLNAQSNRAEDDAEWLDRCRENGRNNDDRGRACEVRSVPVKLSGRSIAIDGRQNGGIRVAGWDGDQVKVTAHLQAEGRTDAAAKALLSSVRIETDGRRVSADGPSMDGYDRQSWSVSYVVFVPRRFDLELEAHNGGLSVADVTGKLELGTTNGSVQLENVGGDVHARTQNGSLNVRLAGRRWDGAGLNAETQNGSVRLAVPEDYAANLETGTVNGRVNTDIPITVKGNISRRMSFPIGGGGPTIRAITTNGSVTIARR
ncbi:MAG: DUF4097 family beta strand repeat-containing protein [Gemmatimonadaceae bacterium]